MKNQTPLMKHLCEQLNDEQIINLQHYKTLVENGHLELSPSAIKKMIDEPIVYFNQYVCGDFDNTETKAQKKGTLLHCLLFEEETFNQKYVVFPKDMVTPEDRALDLVTFVANNSKEGDSVALEDHSKAILDYMKEINYYQNLVDDKKNLSITGDVKRLEKVLTPNNIKYFEYLMSSKDKEIINESFYNEVLHKAFAIKLDKNFSKISIESENEDVIHELELKTVHETSKLNLKCIIDSLKIDTIAKKVLIVDLKSIGGTLAKTLKFDIEKYRYGIQAAINYLCVKAFLNTEQIKEMIPEIEKYEIDFGFYFVDGNNTVKFVQVSKPTMERYISELDMYLNQNVKYHITNMDFTAPFEFLTEDVII